MCWFALVYYKDINSISQIIAGVKRNYEKFAFLARICGEGRDAFTKQSGRGCPSKLIDEKKWALEKLNNRIFQQPE